MDVHLLSQKPRDLSPFLLNNEGCLKTVPAAFFEKTTAEERGFFGVNHGIYGLLTEELVAHLKMLIGDHSTIEIGAGRGELAAALGIVATDSWQQAAPDMQLLYRGLGQAPIQYGKHVEKLDALSAVKKYRPHTVLGCWVTHKYSPARHWAGGNEKGVEEEAVLQACQRYIFIGNESVHAKKSLWSKPHTKYHPAWLYSRAVNGSPDFIAIWER